MIYFIFACASIAIILSLFYFLYQDDKRHNEEIQKAIQYIYNNPPKQKSVSSYYERLEKEQVKIMSDKKKSDYKITLWAGLDGLRLNEDNTTEWIKRGKEKHKSQELKQTTPYFSGMQNAINSTNYYNQIQNAYPSIQNQINSLQTQNANISLLQMQSMQNQNVINSITPTFIQSYPNSFYPFYATSLAQCCCYSGLGFNSLVKW